MRQSQNIKQVCNNGDTPVFKKIISDLSRINFDGWVELTAFKDNRIVYWQLVPEKLNSFIKNSFIKL